MTIIHYLHDSDRKNFVRTLLHTNNSKYKIIADEKYSKYINLEKYDVFFFKNAIESYNIINSINPKLILLTINPSSKLISQLKNNINCKNICYIHHGIFDYHFNYKTHLKHWDKNIKYLISDIYGYNCIKKYVTKNVVKINGLPQFDILLKNNIYTRHDICKNYNLEENKTLILLLNNNSNNINEINEIINCIKNSIKDSIIFLKNKRPKLNINFDKLKNIYLIDPNDMIYNYLKCDINIIINYGTSLLESIIVNPKTILYQYNLIEPNINSVKNIINLKIELEKINRRDNIMDYNNYINKIIGTNIEFISELIINILYIDK